MEPFLKLVAEDLYKKLGGDLSRTALVFPNKRAGLFFDEYLSHCSDKPLWAPAYITISELFRSLSPDIQVADSIKLICELYKVFASVTKSGETLDEFYFWGEMLISDFDDIDKNLANSDLLFSNLKDLKAMDVSDFLTAEQEEAIRQFFVNFSIDKSTRLKEKFISLWNVLGEIYTMLKSNLKEQHLAYEGMLYRDVMEHFEASQLPYDHYVFVGFNVLNRVESALFKEVKKEGKAFFYFDYDISYLKGSNEAGTFIRKNLADFGNELDEASFDNSRKPKQIYFVSSSTENGQARLLPGWIDENLREPEKENAIVLCNESLLQPVIHSLDERVKKVNVTMGFPLSQTPVYSFVSSLFDLQTSGYDVDSGKFSYEQVASVLKHPYTHMLLRKDGEGKEKAMDLLGELTRRNRFYPLPSELQLSGVLTDLFTPQTSQSNLCAYILYLLEEVAAVIGEAGTSERFLSQLYSESLFQTYKLIGRIGSLIEQGDLKVENGLLSTLMNRVLTTATIPFHGEPAEGLQIMGVLETRNLDFKNLIVLSLNEGQLPKKEGESSFIPYNLRRAFGLTTVEKRIALYAYYFYRLIQRAENITLVYNSSTEGINQGEMSRFMLQYLVESEQNIGKYDVQSSQIPLVKKLTAVPKSDEVLDILYRKYDLNVNPDAFFSPTALNAYIACPLRFYYRYVAGLKAQDEVSVDIEASDFGTIFHKVAENIYLDFTGRGSKTVSKDDIETLLKDKFRLERYVDDAFKSEFFKIKPQEKPEYNGLQLIFRAVIINMAKQLLVNDAKLAPITVYGMEWDKANRQVISSDGQVIVQIGGKIDRLDIVDDGTLPKPMLRIVDYKTKASANDEKAVSLEHLFLHNTDHPAYIFQTFLYCTVMSDYLRKKGEVDAYQISPNLFYVAKSSPDDYSPVVKLGKEEVKDFSIYEREFLLRLENLLGEIFNPEIPFEPTTREETCMWCDFKNLCNKK